jgi:hypothetical protein
VAKSNIRRTIIREWMMLAPEKRRFDRQALAFTTSVVERYDLPRRRRSPQAVIMAWLRPRIGRA